MVLLGIDWGEKRIGLAVGDESLGVATPLPAAIQAKKRDRHRAIVDWVERRRAGALVVGYPLNMDGTAGFKAREVDAFIAEMERRTGLPVYRVDERLSSHQVESDLRLLGKKSDRKSGDIDSRAAALILQDFLDERRVSQGGDLP